RLGVVRIESTGRSKEKVTQRHLSILNAYSENIRVVSLDRSYVLDKRTDQPSALSTVVHGHEIIDSLRVESFGLEQELDAVTIRVVSRRRLELLRWREF